MIGLLEDSGYLEHDELLLRCELNRVGEEVEEDLLQSLLICAYYVRAQLRYVQYTVLDVPRFKCVVYHSACEVKDVVE